MEKEIKIQLKEKEKDKTIPQIVSEQIKKHKKILFIISITALLIISINLPNSSNNSLNQSGGIPGASMIKMGAKMQSASGSNSVPNTSNAGDGGDNGPKKKGSLMGSPMTSGIGIMWWILKNILLFYGFLLFITVVPSLPIILYITVFYFIINSLIGKIQTL